MSIFLYTIGSSLLIASIYISLICYPYTIAVFLVIFALGCINIGLGKIIDMYNELIDKQGEIKTDLNRVQVTLDEIKKQNK